MAVEIVRLRVPERVQSYLICRVCVFVLLDTMHAVVTSFPFLMCPFLNLIIKTSDSNFLQSGHVARELAVMQRMRGVKPASILETLHMRRL